MAGEWVATAFLCASIAHWVLLDAAGIRVTLAKVRLYALGAATVVFGRGAPRARRRVDGAALGASRVEASTRLYFVAPGESEWDRVFGAGRRAALPLRLAAAVGREGAMLLARDPGSVLVDAPLTTVGLEAAGEIAALVAGARGAARLAPEDADALAGPASGLVASNLRRALQTAAIGFSARLRSGERVSVTSDLAEISGGLDALPLTPPSAAPVLPRVPAALCSPETFLLDARRGRRPARAAAARLDAFAAYALARPERALVVCGHARWFRSFFDAFLPPSAASVARSSAVLPGGIVRCDLLYGRLPGGRAAYVVAPDSVRVVHRGFDGEAGGEAGARAPTRAPRSPNPHASGGAAGPPKVHAN